MKKHLTRYLLEFAVIVAGITISFWINEWDSSKDDSVRQLHYITGLISDLEKQLLLFDDHIEFSNSGISNCDSILNEFKAKGNLSSIDDINDKLSRLMYSHKYPEVNTIFNELESTGQFDLINNDSLTSKIIKYYQNSNNYSNRVNANMDVVYYQEIFPIIKSSIVIEPQNFGYKEKDIELFDSLSGKFYKGLSEPAKEFDLVNAISLSIVVSNTNRSYVATIKKEAEELLVALEKELVQIQ